jgi:hypothetical protein
MAHESSTRLFFKAEKYSYYKQKPTVERLRSAVTCTAGVISNYVI